MTLIRVGDGEVSTVARVDIDDEEEDLEHEASNLEETVDEDTIEPNDSESGKNQEEE